MQGDTRYRYINDVQYVKLFKIMNARGKKSRMLEDRASQNYFLPRIMSRYLTMGVTDAALFRLLIILVRCLPAPLKADDALL